MSFNEQVPASGWVYHIGRIALMGNSKAQLIEVLRQYRKSNRIPEGDLEKDIEDKIEEENPGYKFSDFKMIVQK